MDELRERFRQLDRIEPPDVWRDIERLGPREEAERGPTSGQRLAAGALALIVAAAGIGLAVRALRTRPDVGGTAVENGAVMVFGFSEPDRSTRLFLIDGNGSATPLPTSPDGPVIGAEWSDDGTTVAYVIEDGVGSPDVRAIGADGSNDRLICSGCATSVYVGAAGERGEPSIGDRLTALWVEPGGERVRVATVRDGAIEIVDSEAPGETVVVPRGEGPFDDDLAWSSDGERLAFASRHPGTTDVPARPELDGIYVVNADGSGLTQVSHPPGPPYTHVPDTQPAWSPDGSQIAFARRLGTFEEGSPLQTGDHSEIWVVGADGTGERQVTDTTQSDGPPRGPAGATSPSWSPAGDTIAYLADREAVINDSDVWTIRADGSDPRYLYACDLPSGSARAPCPAYGSLRWSPDGTEVTMDAWHPRGQTPYALDAASGELRDLAPGVIDACCVRWQPLPAGSTEPEPTVSVSPDAELYESPLGWAAQVPESWHVLEFEGFTGRQTIQGAAFSTEPLRPTADGTHPDLSELFPDGAALIVSHREGGPAPDVWSDDSTFPLRWEDFRAIPGGLVVGSVQYFRANGADLTLELAVRADAPAELLQTLQSIVASIRPAPMTAGQQLPTGYIAIDAGPVGEVGSGAVFELDAETFLVVHAPGGYYALDLPTEVPATSVFTWDAEAQEVVWTQEGEVFARYDRAGQPVLSPEGADLALLAIHPVVDPWGGTHLLLHPSAGYGSLPDDFWGDA